MRPLPEIVLKDVAAYIEKHGWCQNVAWTDEGAVCLVGALIRAEVENYCETRDVIIKRLGLRNAKQLIDWNNAPGRTKEEVLSVLRGEF